MRKAIMHLFIFIVLFSFYNTMHAMDSGELAKLKADASNGDVKAQATLGCMYFEGQGVTQDFKVAVKWMRMAVDQGNPVAQYLLGSFYQRASGKNTDFKEAAKWYRLAAEQGNVNAQYSLGCMYTLGQGVSMDNKEGIKWIQMAANQGYAIAQNLLGMCYALGTGVIQDDKESFKWLLLACTNCDITSDDFKQYCKNRDLIKEHLTHSEISQAQIEARAIQDKIDLK